MAYALGSFLVGVIAEGGGYLAGRRAEERERQIVVLRHIETKCIVDLLTARGIPRAYFFADSFRNLAAKYPDLPLGQIVELVRSQAIVLSNGGGGIGNVGFDV